VIVFSKRRKEKLIAGIAIISIFLFLAFFPWKLWATLGEGLKICKGNDLEFDLETVVNLLSVYVKADQEGIVLLNGEPVQTKACRLDLNSPLLVKAEEEGTVNLKFSLFGFIPLREMTVNVIPEVKLFPGGHSVGIKLHSQGVIVVAFQDESPGRDAGIKVGDSIVGVEGEEVEDTNHAARLIQKYGKNGEVKLTINREGRKRVIRVSPKYVQEADSYRIGLFIRDTAAGVGTLTFYDPETNRYGALGHVISDLDTNEPIEIKDGELVAASIVKIRSAKRGQPGEKTGVFVSGESALGSIDVNTRFGVFGQLFSPEQLSSNSDFKKPIPVGMASQVRPGAAQILTVLEGEQIESFSIEIERIIRQAVPNDKGMVVKITDPRLLEVTGGIVQGMSGSPIIQDGMLVGAVTHVFVNDPTRGYAVFLE